MEARFPDGPLGASITSLHGFVTSVISGPIIVPSEWIPIVFGDSDESAWADTKQAEQRMNLLMRFQNEVADGLYTGRFAIMIDRVGEPPDTEDFADDWCLGYALGLSLREDEWQEPMEDEDVGTYFLPILAVANREPDGVALRFGREEYDEVLQAHPQCAVAIYDWWRKKLYGSTVPQAVTVRRAGPKVSPNAPCPCGSGKKYKRCCSPLRST